MPSDEYTYLKLSAIISRYIDIALKEKDWEIIAVDPDRDVVVLKRFNP